MDVINEVSKTYVEDPSDPKRPALPDAPISDPNATYQAAHMLFCNGPRIHEVNRILSRDRIFLISFIRIQFMREMHEKVLQHYDTITVGETPHAKHPSIVLPWVNPHVSVKLSSSLLRHPRWSRSDSKDAIAEPRIANVLHFRPARCRR